MARSPTGRKAEHHDEVRQPLISASRLPGTDAATAATGAGGGLAGAAEHPVDATAISIVPGVLEADAQPVRADARGCHITGGQLAVNTAKLTAHLIKRYGQDVVIAYAAYSLALMLNEDLESPNAYVFVLGSAGLSAIEDTSIKGFDYFRGASITRAHRQEYLRIVINGLDACFAAGVFLGAYKEENTQYTIGASIVGTALGIANIGVNVVEHTQPNGVPFAANAFRAASIAVNTVSQYCMAAGAVELVTFFIKNVSFDSRHTTVPADVDITAQNAVGAVFALLLLAAKLKQSKRLEEISESVLHGVIHYMMGVTLAFDAYTSIHAESDSIPNVYGYSMMVLFALTSLGFYGFDIRQHYRHGAGAEAGAVNAECDGSVEAAISDAAGISDVDAMDAGADVSDADDENAVAGAAAVGADATISTTSTRSITSYAAHHGGAGTLFQLPQHNAQSMPNPSLLRRNSAP